jgi:succinyl-diaminopimelate desuccinylase
MELRDILGKIDASRGDMTADMMSLIRIPAIGPANGGKGEGLRADRVLEILKGFDTVERIDVKDMHDGTVMRPNILAVKKGKGRGTVWIISHLDTVLPGDLDEWRTPPYEPVVKDGKIFGLGTEDNGQAIISSIYAAKFFDRGSLSKRSIGLAIVADEETTSAMGIEHLINAGLFGPDDVFIVPDWGVPGGTMVEVAEKHLVWLKFTVSGRQTHGSTPQKGLNAYRVSAKMLVDVLDRLEKRYDAADPLFRPQGSTFEPTKSIATVGNVNTIPGYHEFWLDIRLLPSYDPDDLIVYAKEVGAEWAKNTGAEITVTVEQRTRSGRPSDTDCPEFAALRDSISSVIGKGPETVGVGGGTCANFFRLAGYNAYVWQCGGGSLHQPNEYCDLDNLTTDAKVFATLFSKLCV